MSPTEKRNLERVRYWQGQMLRSRDFNDIHAVEEQRRWWHNRALHNAYGIHQDPDTGRGFSVAFNADKTQVIVKRGLAYDSFGRELILETDQTVPLPPITQDDEEFLLLLRYRMNPPNGRMEGLAGVCYTDSGPLRPGFVEFTWQHKDKCAFADGVPLATLEIKKGERLPPALINTPSSRPLARPQIGSGSTVPGNTAWELWTVGVGREETVMGVQTTIDTSASGFTDDPCYFAWLQGNVFSPQTRQLAPALFTSIAEESVNSFIFRIAFPQLDQGLVGIAAVGTAPAIHQITADEFPLFARKQDLYVNWVGCQKNASAPFFFTLLLNPRFFLNLTLLQLALPLELTLLQKTLIPPK